MNVQTVGKPINWLARTKTSKKVMDYAVKSTTNAARVLVVGNLLRDGVRCIFYVWQSITNEKIPKEKRKFVAALDFSNGVYNIATQWILGYLVLTNSIQDKLAEKLFGKQRQALTKYMRKTAEDILKKEGKTCYDLERQINLAEAEKELRKIVEKYPEKYRKNLDIIDENLIKKEAACKEVLGRMPMKSALNHYSVCSNGFKLFITLFITTVFARRMVVPFLSTPTAGFIKSKYLTDKETKAIPDNSKKDFTIQSGQNVQKFSPQYNSKDVFELYKKIKNI